MDGRVPLLCAAATMKSRVTACVFSALLVVLSVSEAARAAAPELRIGDPAPELAPMSWLRGEPVGRFEPGRVYVVDFWATWCAPCIAAMPHLTELARQYRNDVTFVAIDVREVAHEDGEEIDVREVERAVRAFVEDHDDVMGYVVAMDHPVDNDVFAAWMTASGNYALPTTFIVDRQGRLAWVGHPSSRGNGAERPTNLGDALPKVLDGTLDTAAARSQQDALNAMTREYLTDRSRMQPMNDALERRDYRRMLDEADELVRQYAEYENHPLVFNARFLAGLHLDEDGALEYANRKAQQKEALKAVGGAGLEKYWQTVSTYIVREEGLSRSTYEIAAGHLRQLVDESPSTWSWSVMAEAQYRLNDLDAAVAAQENAIQRVDELAGSMDTGPYLAELQARLSEFRREQAAGRDSTNRVRTRLSTVELIGEQAELGVSDETFTLAVRLQPDPGWHAYWVNPGDAGQALQIHWTLPDGATAGDLEFPPPRVLPFGDLVTYGYDGELVLLSTVTLPGGPRKDEPFDIRAGANWVVCDDETCVPESAELALRLPVGERHGNDDQRSLFARARASLPEVPGWPADVQVTEDTVAVRIATSLDTAEIESAYWFPVHRRQVRYAEQTAAWDGGELLVGMNAGVQAAGMGVFDGLLRVDYRDGNSRAYRITARRDEAGSAAAPDGIAAIGLFKALIFAVIGGMVLNLMPCVFPILSLKAISLVTVADDDAQRAGRGGAAYTLGVLTTFLLAAAVLIALRAGGQAIGWGFQLQVPAVNLGLALLMVAVGLNLLDTFDFGSRLAATVGNAGHGWTAGHGPAASFFTGMLAVVVATPCTAPFMAAALGYALTQPAATALGVFLALGLGFALPYLSLSCVPALRSRLPRPGIWMQHFRHVMAFPMFISALWLFWVMGRQSGVSSMTIGMLAAIVASFALWSLGKAQRAPNGSPAFRAVAVAAMLLCIAVLSRVEFTNAPEVRAFLGETPIERFEPGKIESYVAAGRPVFAYFTADWCVSCKVNENVALEDERVGDVFERRGITVIEGDWTDRDDAITRLLERHHRIGVPLYLYYPEGSKADEPVILPQLLTPQIVLDALT